MISSFRTYFAAGLLACGIGMAAPAALAMPMGLDSGLAAQADTAAKPENIRWVCGPYRCRWAPNRPVYGYGFYGRPRYYGARRFYGPRRGFRRW